MASSPRRQVAVLPEPWRLALIRCGQMSGPLWRNLEQDKKQNWLKNEAHIILGR